ncbi:sugar ABC transporter ATP-binding protein [Paenibacillus sp.]|uniref:sugar ABC transporter ATP-binding protein n=1 Tax=Paenibacillus sp. TaxID=58172 RepID=UPI00356988C3
MQEQYVLEMEHISKTFPGVRALEDVSFKVRKGTVHALMGENGAGKSTLMKILGGIYWPETGRIKLRGKEIGMLTPRDSLKNGISMIHQELTSVYDMTVAENIFLGREPLFAKFWVNEKKLNEDTRHLLESLEISIDPKTKMKDLSIARMQLVEIAKAISYNSEIIIMDEPTSAITDREVAHLFKIIRSLTNKGVSIIYISHKMDEIFEIADEITVLRDGELVDSKHVKELTQQDLISMMVGRELKELFPKKEVRIGEKVLEVKNLSLKGKFNNISFQLRKGEILGIAGLMGSGRSEVMESLFGLAKPDEGEIFFHGKKVEIKSPEDAKKNGLAFITEDRKLTGLFLPHSVKDNMIAASLEKHAKGIFMNEGKIRNECNKQRELLGVKTPDINQKVKNLSGGNQQKVLIAKWLLTDAEVIILDEPTRGVDVGAKSEIHALMGKLVEEGKAVIMISSEMPEVLGMSDRIIVMHEGKISGELSRAEANQDKIMKYATGFVN